MDLLERRAERAAHLQELQTAAREAYLKEVRADIAQNIKLTQVTWVGAWQVLMTTKIHKARRVMPTSQKRFGPENDDRDDDDDDDDDDDVVDDDDIAGFSGYGIAWQGQQLRRGK